MAANTRATHCTSEEMDAYFSGAMPDREAELLERHIGSCERCMEFAGPLSKSLWALETWTVTNHAAAILQERVAASLQEAAANEPAGGVRDRLRNWHQSWKGLAGAAFKLPIGVGVPAVEALQSLFCPNPLRLQFAGGTAGAGGTIRTRGAVRTRGGAKSAGATPSSKSATPFNVVRKNGGVEVQIAELPKGARPLLVLLPSGSAERPLVSELERMPQASEFAWRAFFPKVPPGDCMLLFEPEESPSA